jgi:hypothetical protein
MSEAIGDDIDWQKILDSRFDEERAYVRGMSDAARFVCAGTLALFYAAMFADRSALADFFRARGLWLWLAADCGAAALVFDLLRSWAGLSLARQTQIWLIAHWKQRAGGPEFVKAYNASLKAAKRLGLPLRGMNRTMSALSLIAALAAVAGAYFAPPAAT